MRSFSAVLVFALAVNNSLAVEWADSGIKLSTSQVCKKFNNPIHHNIFLLFQQWYLVSKIVRKNCSSDREKNKFFKLSLSKVDTKISRIFKVLLK